MRFLGLEIDIPKGVFEPRVETEYWVSKAIEIIKDKYESPLVLDLFAGTGCIGRSVLDRVPGSEVHFVDISSKAVDAIGVKRAKVFEGSFFEPVSERYDVIMANPPYVALNRRAEVDPNVLNSDPKEALFSGEEGMDSIERFINEVGDHLKPNGMFCMEFDPQQKEKIKKLLESNGYNFSFEKDQFGKIRWIQAYG